MKGCSNSWELLRKLSRKGFGPKKFYFNRIYRVRLWSTFEIKTCF